MIYELAKALHVVCVIIWMSGMVAAALTLMHPALASARNVHRWDRFATSPAMVLTWILGLVLAQAAGWFGDGWLSVKLVLVVVLSGMHGVLSGRLRRIGISKTLPVPDHSIKIWLVAMFASLAVIVVLVMIKPF